MEQAGLNAQLGFDLGLKGDDLLVSAVAVLRIIDADGEERIAMRWTPMMSAVERRGMIEMARDAEQCSIGWEETG